MPTRSWNRSGLSWSAVLRDLKDDRRRLPPVREERLRTNRAPGVRLSAWRGRSGQRYVVQVLTLDEAAATDAPGAVILGVRRGADGMAVLLGAGHQGSVAEGAALTRADRATEIHLHRLAETEAERDAIVEDLVSEDDA